MNRLRGRLNAVDPWNLTQIMLAEGKTVRRGKGSFVDPGLSPPEVSEVHTYG